MFIVKKLILIYKPLVQLPQTIFLLELDLSHSRGPKLSRVYTDDHIYPTIHLLPICRPSNVLGHVESSPSYRKVQAL